MQIAIVDDLESDRLQLEGILREYRMRHQLDLSVSHFASGEAFLESYQPYRYTVIFLDIFMDGLSGIETAERIREGDEDANLVFLTTSDVHRPEAFSLFAVSYIPKPCDRTQVFRVLDHLLHVKTGQDKCFSFSYGRREYSLRCADIVSVETDGNYQCIVDKDGKTYRTRMTFSTVESLLDARFIRRVSPRCRIAKERCWMALSVAADI